MSLLHVNNPILLGAITGAIAAAHVDIQAFRSWRSFADARQYSWGIALWRWFQGAVIGSLASAGLSSF